MLESPSLVTVSVKCFEIVLLKASTSCLFIASCHALNVSTGDKAGVFDGALLGPGEGSLLEVTFETELLLDETAGLEFVEVLQANTPMLVSTSANPKRTDFMSIVLCVVECFVSLSAPNGRVDAAARIQSTFRLHPCILSSRPTIC